MKKKNMRKINNKISIFNKKYLVKKKINYRIINNLIINNRIINN